MGILPLNPYELPEKYPSIITRPLLITILVGGWATPLKSMKVNWDDEISNIWENKVDVPNHQPVVYNMLINADKC